MKISIISDVHIKSPHDKASALMLAFLRSKEALSSDKIVLLGDIFDLFVGGHTEYLIEYKMIFDEMILRMKEGIEILYFEGNHDFHIAELLRGFTIGKNVGQNFQFIKTSATIKHGNKVFIFSHGDDVELRNYSYKIYKKLINNKFMEYIANNVFSYELIKMIGRYASRKSREQNRKKYVDEEDYREIKDNFRRASEKLWHRQNFDYFICGHSHVKDNYLSQRGFRYLNNGYALQSQSFLFFNGESFSFIPLS